MTAPNVRGFFDPVTATWTYVVWSGTDSRRRCAIIDSVLDYDMPSSRTGTASADTVITFVHRKELEVEWILETHIHADHITAARYLKERLGGKIAMSRHMLNIIATWVPVFQTGDDTPADGADFDHLFENDETFTIGDLKAKIIHTPGHTPADTTYIIEDAARRGFRPLRFPGRQPRGLLRIFAQTFCPAGPLPHICGTRLSPGRQTRPRVHEHRRRTKAEKRTPAHGH